MSDSEAKKLVGIARSIDALFTGAPPVSVEAVATAEPEASSVPEAPSPEASPTGDELDLMGDGWSDAPADDVQAEPPADPPAGDVQADAVPVPEADFDDSLTLQAAEVDDETPPVPTPDHGAESADAAADEGAPPEEAVSALDAAVAAYLAGDESQAEEIRSQAEAALGRHDLDGVARAVGRIAMAAGDPPDSGRAELATSIASEPVLGRLALHMGSERDEAVRAEYFVACRVLGRPMAEAIRDHLADSTDRLARRVHCDALAAMGPDGREVIEEMALDENRFLVRNAVAILGETGGDRAVELVTSALANPDARVRREALRSLTKLGDESSGDVVLGMLEDPDADVRMAAAVAAGELHVERSLKTLIKMLEETKDADDAILLIRALGHLGDPGAVSSIEKWAVRSMFSKPRTDARIAAYRALHQIGTPHARRLLNQALDDKEAPVKAAVKEILGMR